MWFLMEYDRRRGVAVSLTTYPDDQRRQAEETRLSKELSLGGDGDSREIVLLQAASEDALRKTHRRYFEALFTLATST